MLKTYLLDDLEQETNFSFSLSSAVRKVGNSFIPTWTIRIAIAMKKKYFMHCSFDNFIDNNESRWDFGIATEVWMNQKFLYLQVFCLMKYFQVAWIKESNHCAAKNFAKSLTWQLSRPIDNRLDFHRWQQPYARKIADLLSLTHADDLAERKTRQQTRHSPIAWQQPLVKKFKDLSFTKQVKNVFYWILFLQVYAKSTCYWLFWLWFFRTLWKPFKN